MHKSNLNQRKKKLFIFLLVSGSLFFLFYGFKPKERDNIFAKIKKEFLNPSDAYHPGVYWYFMNGNLSKEGISKDLQSMKNAGISSVIFLEVNVGVPRGPVDFFSEQWQDLFAYAEHECERLGIEMIMGIGPGWAGSGGPWVKPEASMQHLTASIKYVSDTSVMPIKLQIPLPRKPYFRD